jgi:menaquinone-dependent protoporphyrinogen IX oxidase
MAASIPVGYAAMLGYAARTGSTQEVAAAIAATLREDGHSVICEPTRHALPHEPDTCP